MGTVHWLQTRAAQAARRQAAIRNDTTGIGQSMRASRRDFLAADADLAHALLDYSETTSDSATRARCRASAIRAVAGISRSLAGLRPDDAAPIAARLEHLVQRLRDPPPSGPPWPRAVGRPRPAGR